MGRLTLFKINALNVCSPGRAEVPREHVARLRAGQHRTGLGRARSLRAAAAPGAPTRRTARCTAARAHAADTRHGQALRRDCEYHYHYISP